MMKQLEELFAKPDFVGTTLTAKTSNASYKVKEAANFSYTDPIDHSVSKNQGLYVTFEDGSRVVWRLSGTGSQGATVRVYYEKRATDPSEYELDAQEGLKPIIEIALEISKLTQLLGREKPTVIT